MPIFPGARALCAVAARGAGRRPVDPSCRPRPSARAAERAPAIQVGAAARRGARPRRWRVSLVPRPRPSHRQLVAAPQGLAFLQVALIAMRVLNHASMTSAVPWADARLAGWDAALGLALAAATSTSSKPGPGSSVPSTRATSSLDRLAVLALLLLVRASATARRAALLRRDLPRDGDPLHGDRPAVPGAGGGRHPHRGPACVRQLPVPARTLPPRGAASGCAAPRPARSTSRGCRASSPSRRSTPRPASCSSPPSGVRPAFAAGRRLCRGDDRRHPGLRRALLRRPRRRRRASRRPWWPAPRRCPPIAGCFASATRARSSSSSRPDIGVGDPQSGQHPRLERLHRLGLGVVRRGRARAGAAPRARRDAPHGRRARSRPPRPRAAQVS